MKRGVRRMLESSRAKLAQSSVVAWALSALVLVFMSASAFCQDAIGTPGPADRDEPPESLVAELKEGAAANRDHLVNLFCRRMFLDARQRDLEHDGQWELMRAERICARCKVSPCPEYEEWLDRDLARRAAEIRAARSECLDRTLSRPEVIRCRSRIKPYLNHW